MALALSAPGTGVVAGERLGGAPRPLGPVEAWTPAAGHADLPAGTPEQALEALFELRPTAWLRRIPGRETLAWPHADGACVLKRFLGDDAAEAWAAWLRLRAPASPGRREAANLSRLAADGFPVPRVLGWWEERNRGGGLGAHRFARSAVLMERVVHTQTLRDALERSPRSSAARWGGELAALVAALHRRGWYHRDLYLQHLILAEAQAGEVERLVLLDVGRARCDERPRRRWFVKDLAALLHSTPACVGARARLRFLARYCAARGLDSRAARRDLARAVAAKARRLAAHVPRHVDPDDRARGDGA
jgi:hypothetical protein